MDNQSFSDKLAAIVVAIMLILTAWGNAVVMLIVAVIGLVAIAIFYRNKITQGGLLAAAVGLAVAIGIGLATLIR